MRIIPPKDTNPRLVHINSRVSFVRHDFVKPVPEGTIIAMMFRITGYEKDADGSAMIVAEQINRQGESSGWEIDKIGLYQDSAVILDSPDELHQLAEDGYARLVEDEPIQHFFDDVDDYEG